MPNIKSAIKRVKVNGTKTSENTRIKTAYKTAIKNFLSEVEAGNKENITEAYKTATKAIEKAATKGIIKDNTASRKISSLTKVLNTVK